MRECNVRIKKKTETRITHRSSCISSACTWINANTISTIRAPNRKGPRKPKSCPLFAAQNVYRVRLMTTTAVKITASNITFPVAK